MKGYKRYIKSIQKKNAAAPQKEKNIKKGPPKKRIKILTLDTETRGFHGPVFRIGLFDGKSYFVKNNFRELLPIINHFSKNFECHIYVHNLDFDLKKGADYLMGKVDLKKTQFINNVAAIFSTRINNLMNDPEQELENENITFHCSYQLIPRSLDDISKSFKLEQAGKMDLKEILIEEHYDLYDIKTREYDDEGSKNNYFMNVDPLDENLNRYLKMDCLSLYEIVTRLHELSKLPLHEFIRCPSVASLSLKIYKTIFSDDYKKAVSGYRYSPKYSFIEDFLRAAYSGGRTEVFKNKVEKGFYYDVNSLYPYVMKNFKMPYGNPVFYNEHEKIKERLIKDDLNGVDTVMFIEANIFVPDTINIPVLPTLYRGKLCFLTGYITGIWTDKEIKKALQVGCKVKEYKQMLYFHKTDYLFQNFVNQFEEMKVTSTGAAKEFSKLILNSLYGKFGMRRKFKSLLEMDQLEKVKASGIDYSTMKNTHYDKEMIITTTTTQAEYIQVHISAYITSLARLVLYEAIEHVEKQGGHIYYCDTDSIISDIPLPAHLIDENEFGKWQQENELLEGIFIGPKNYALITNEEKIIKKSKGIPKKYVKKMGYDFYQKLLKDKKTLARRYVEVAEIQQFQKSKVSLKNNEKMDTYKTITKGIHLDRMEKRIFNIEENTSRPHFVNFWGEGAKDLPDNEYYKVDPTKTYQLLEKEYYEENDFLLLLVSKFGKIRRPNKKEPYYKEIKSLDPSIREKYFTLNKNNPSLHVFVQDIDNINIEGIIEELTEQQNALEKREDYEKENRIEIY